MRLRLGVDVGGTFTDIYLQDASTGAFWIAKTPTTPHDQSVGVLNGINEVCARAEVDPESLTAILHGTTVATNAVLEGKGAPVGLLITGGWKYLLHLGSSWTPGPLFGFFSYQKPAPLVPLERIYEIAERVTPDGSVLTPLDTHEVERAVNALLDQRAEAITICFLNSYADSTHERAAAEIAKSVCAQRGVELPISCSHEVSGEFREYPRVITTVMNSYLGPVMRRYLSNLDQSLKSSSVDAPLHVVRSDGGLMSAAAAAQHPVQTALSGPSGGVNGAASECMRAGFERIITFDMGGTSTDVAVCLGGTPTITRETSVGAFPVRAPSVEVATIGAGGGSIANVSEITGALRVGPESAGALPGPASYGHGGKLPTVTDANVVLGHLPPVLLGGAMQLDVVAAHAAVGLVAQELGVDVYAAAQAIVDIVNGNMLGALRVATVQKGLDPSSHALVSFGGAGGLHANALAALLGCYPVIVPEEPGVLSALGFVSADMRNEFTASVQARLDSLDLDDVRNVQNQLREKAIDWLTHENIEDDHRVITHVLDMRFLRQGYELPVEFSDHELHELSIADLADRFRAEHQRLYGFDLDGVPVELINTRCVGIGRTDAVARESAPLGTTQDPSTAQVGEQMAYTDGNLVPIPVYERSLLRPGMKIAGKAIVRQYDSTTLILPRHVASVDPCNNLLIEVEAS